MISIIINQVPSILDNQRKFGANLHMSVAEKFKKRKPGV